MNHKWWVEVMRRAHEVWGQVRYLATPTGNLRPSVRRKPRTSTYLGLFVGLWIGGLRLGLGCVWVGWVEGIEGDGDGGWAARSS